MTETTKEALVEFIEPLLRLVERVGGGPGEAADDPADAEGLADEVASLYDAEVASAIRRLAGDALADAVDAVVDGAWALVDFAGGDCERGRARRLYAATRFEPEEWSEPWDEFDSFQGEREGADLWALAGLKADLVRLAREVGAELPEGVR